MQTMVIIIPFGPCRASGCWVACWRWTRSLWSAWFYITSRSISVRAFGLGSPNGSGWAGQSSSMPSHRSASLRQTSVVLRLSTDRYSPGEKKKTLNMRTPNLLMEPAIAWLTMNSHHGSAPLTLLSLSSSYSYVFITGFYFGFFELWNSVRKRRYKQRAGLGTSVSFLCCNPFNATNRNISIRPACMSRVYVWKTTDWEIESPTTTLVSGASLLPTGTRPSVCFAWYISFVILFFRRGWDWLHQSSQDFSQYIQHHV